MIRAGSIPGVLYDAFLTTLGRMPASCGHASCSCNDLSLWNRPPTQLRMHVPLRSGRRQFAEAVGAVTGRFSVRES